MTQETKELAQKIEQARNKRIKKVFQRPTSDYQIAIDMLTNLIGCVLMGLALGVLFQNVFQTPVELTVCLTFFGGFVGLFQAVREALTAGQEKKNKKASK